MGKVLRISRDGTIPVVIATAVTLRLMLDFFGTRLVRRKDVIRVEYLPKGSPGFNAVEMLEERKR